MDGTGCPYGYATDILFTNRQSPRVDLCAVDMRYYWGFILLTLSIRTLVSLFQLRVGWFVLKIRRGSVQAPGPTPVPQPMSATTTTTVPAVTGNVNGNLRKDKNQARVGNEHEIAVTATPIPKRRVLNGKGNRVPLTLLLETVHTFLLIIVFILFGFGYGTQYDGLGMSLFGICISFFVFSFMFSCLKMVHLGDKVLPKKVRITIRINRPGEINEELERSQRLQMIDADVFLRLCFRMMYISQFVALLIWILPGTILFQYAKVPNNLDLYTHLGLLFQSFAICAGYLILLRQTIRVTNHIENFTAKISKMRVDQSEIKRTIRMMRIRIAVMFFAVTPNILVFFVGGCGVKFTWELAACQIFTSAFGGFSSTLSYIPRNMRICPCSTGGGRGSKNDSSHNNGSKPSSHRKHDELTTISGPGKESATSRFGSPRGDSYMEVTDSKQNTTNGNNNTSNNNNSNVTELRTNVMMLGPYEAPPSYNEYTQSRGGSDGDNEEEE